MALPWVGMAYLLPAAAWALANQRSVVVSTHTTTLQEQLHRHDIPLVAALLPADPAAYALVLDDPIPFATRAVVHLRLALDDDARESFAEVAFTTAEPPRLSPTLPSEIFPSDARY